MKDEIAAKLTAIVEIQQQQIDDVHRLLVALADAVVGDASLPAALDRHSAELRNMIENGNRLQREALARSEARRKEVQDLMGIGRRPEATGG